MKKRNALLGLVIMIAMVLGSFQMVFATDEPTSAEFDREKFESRNTVTDEAAFDALVNTVYKDFTDSKYGIVDTETMQAWIAGGKDMLVIDTMPFAWYKDHHIPTAVNAEAGDAINFGPFTDEQKAAMMDIVKEYSGTKQVKNKTYYWNSNTKKWTTKKPASKYWKKCTKKGDKHYGKKSYTTYKTVDVKDKTIVVYCGFVKCKRSHEAAKYLVEQGYTNVYRYAGGISAWADKSLEDPDNYVVMKTVVEEEPAPAE
jgi:rhodanese-related sulfurtransferase